jgi:hypothetical protein
MIISDGTTNLTYTGTQSDDFLPVEQSSTRTAGGSSRTIRVGKRFATIEQIRLTGSELLELINLLTNGASEYYYTPTVTPDYLTSSDFPMAVSIGIPKKQRHVGGGDKKYYVELEITGKDYL